MAACNVDFNLPASISCTYGGIYGAILLFVSVWSFYSFKHRSANFTHKSNEPVGKSRGLKQISISASGSLECSEEKNHSNILDEIETDSREQPRMMEAYCDFSFYCIFFLTMFLF